MSLSLSTQKELRNCQTLPFCYLCGQPIENDRSRDHIPPKAIFADADRTPPLILPTHGKCNNAQSEHDKILSQLIAVLHGRFPEPNDMKLKLEVGQVPGKATPTALMDGPDLRPLVWRWISGFHAALYREHLPITHMKRQVHLPMPEGQRKDGKIVVTPIPPLFPKIAEEMKKNRVAQQIDRVICYNGKCEYNCVWVHADRGQWLCFFALRLYGWEDLGDRNMGPQRGCVGAYQPLQDCCPDGASKGTSLIIPLPRTNPLDPFDM